MADKLKLLSKQDQDEFDRYWACWANNHNGWSKQKKKNRRAAKRKLKAELKAELENEEEEVEEY